MCMSKPKMPPAPKPLAPPPKMADADVQAAYDNEKAAARAAAGRSGTIKTSPDLVSTDVNTTQRTLLG